MVPRSTIPRSAVAAGLALAVGAVVVARSRRAQSHLRTVLGTEPESTGPTHIELPDHTVTADMAEAIDAGEAAGAAAVVSVPAASA